MTTEVNINRQTVLHAQRDISYDDFVSGTAKNLIHLQPGTRIIGGYIEVHEGWNSETSATIAIGDTVGSSPDVDKYHTAEDIHDGTITAATVIALDHPPVAGGVIPAGGAWLTATVTVVDAAGDLDEGSATIHIDYIEDGRVSEYNTFRG